MTTSECDHRYVDTNTTLTSNPPKAVLECTLCGDRIHVQSPIYQFVYSVNDNGELETDSIRLESAPIGQEK